MRLASSAIIVSLLAVAASAVAAQHLTRPADLTEGARIYRSTCALCHGLDGTKVSGVSLGSGQFRRASTDDDLVRIIRQGIPGTAMPSGTFSDEEAASLAAYLHAMSTIAGSASLSASSDVKRGQALVEGKGQCLTCHTIGRVGKKSGPDLSGIGRLRKADELALSIVDPGAEVLYSYRTFVGTMRGGSTITGRVLNEDAFTVQVVDGEGQLTSLTKSDLRHYEFLRRSPMPSYKNMLTPDELSDVVAYLVSLRIF
jgi:putative heme-binding domain-containing protein